MIEPRICPVCNSQRKNGLYKQAFSVLSGGLQLAGYDVVTCSDCGFAFADNLPNQDWFDSYYRDMSKYTYDQRYGEESPVDKARFQSITSMITKHLPDRNSCILDYGCATGSLLNHLKNEGYAHLLGVDKSPTAANVAQKLFSLQVVDTDLEFLARTGKAFDLLILSGVLEHVRDLDALLVKIRSAVRRNGLVYVEVPDIVGFEDHVDTPFQEFSIEHINYFSSGSLTRFLSCYGFAPIEVMRVTRDYTAINKMAVLCGFFRLTEEPSTAAGPDKESLPALKRYIEKSLREEQRIADLVADLVARKTPLIVWGVGTYTLHMLQNTEFGKMNIITFVDSNKNYQGQTLLGKPILAPSELHAYPQTILISSRAFHAEIEGQVRQKLHLPNAILALR